jgi:CRISPR-associated endonuclease/helicase Cas3
MNPIAHAPPNGQGEPHDLKAHLHGVATRAVQNATPFGGDVWAELAALWHDIGKYQPAWQGYLRRVSGYDAENAHIEGMAGHPNHSTAGAMLSCEKHGIPGRVLAYLIAGHHAGLDDWTAGLDARFARPESITELNESKLAAPAELLNAVERLPALSTVHGGSKGFALWVRMLFSCLVDADFLDTEEYMNPAKSDIRGNWPKLGELHRAFDEYMIGKMRGSDATSVNRLRAEVLAQCRAKAQEPPGLFTLTVPTGGGKTLSSLAFALEHAKKYEKRRIIYVIPYTSIIEQTADEFRKAFKAVGDEVLIEHHSNAEADPKQENSRSRLSCENWDAPVVVTTSVQFFESLFAAKTSRCRKLHNIVNSVVVLDEAQLLPPEYLQPILDVLNLLTKHYGVTLVLSTATQPALATINDYVDPKKHIAGLDNVREIITDPDALYCKLKRVTVELPKDLSTPDSWEHIAERMGALPSALAIVNTRKDALELHSLLPKDTIHLSALMCGAHRSVVIARIKERIAAKAPVRVVSTQLVEAGVDLDFPVVFRALAGLDSIAQAAGRCNREGKLERGTVFVFVPPKAPPLGLLRKGYDACKTILHGHEDDPLERSLFTTYFKHLYYACDLDKKQIRADLRMDGKNLEALAVNFRTASENFKLVEDGDMVPIIVQYTGPDGTDTNAAMLIARLRKGKPERWLMRKLQRYAVNVHRRYAEPMQQRGDIEELMPGLFVQVGDVLYHKDKGLQIDHIQLPPDQLTV